MSTISQDRAGVQNMDKFMRTHRFERPFDGDPEEYYGWIRKVQTATDLEFRKVLDENWVGQLLNPIINFSEDGIAHGLYTRVKARTDELWKALEEAITNPGTASAAVRKKRQETLTAWRDDEQVLSLVIRSLMTPKLQDRIIYDKIRNSGRKILDELDKVYQPLGQKAIIRMTAQLYVLEPTPGESVIDFLCRIRKLVDQLAAAGSPTSNDVLHEIVPKRLLDQPGMGALANRWIHNRDAHRDISQMIDECREEIRNNPSQSFAPPQLYTKETNVRGYQVRHEGRWDRKFPRRDGSSHGHSRHRKFHQENFKKKIFHGRCFNCDEAGHKASDCKRTMDRLDERDHGEIDRNHGDNRQGRKVSCGKCEDRDGRRDIRKECDDEEEGEVF